MTNANHCISVAVVGGRHDSAPSPWTGTWDELAEMLIRPPLDHEKLAVTENPTACSASITEAKDGAGYMPVTLIRGGKRRREDVATITALALDLDKGTPLLDIEMRLGRYEYALHSTYSHSPETPRFRVVLPLKNPIQAARFADLFDRFNLLFDSMLDRSCGHDPARLYYFGRCPREAVKHFVGLRHEGELLDADEAADTAEGGAPPHPVSIGANPIAEPPSSAAKGKPDFRRGYSDGDRTEALLTRAGSCLADGMTLNQAITKCLEWNEHNTPPLDAEKVLATVKGVAATVARRREQAMLDYDAQMTAMNDRYVWVLAQSRVFRLEHNDFATPADIRNTHGNRLVEVREGTQTGERPLGDAWLRSPARRDVTRVVYEPGKERFYDDSLNTWLGWGCEPKEGDVARWTAYLGAMFAGDTAAAKWFEQWAAYPLQYPGTKLATAVVVWSVQQGVGKTLLGQALGRLYGEANFRTITAATLHGNFNSWAKGCQFVLGEENAGSDQRADANALKHLITGGTVNINEKHQPEVEQRNVMNFLFTSNHSDAFYLDAHDRRLFVWEVTCGKLGSGIYRAFVDWLGDGGTEALMYHLQRLDLTGFDPNSEAPMTNAKLRMIDQSRSELERWLDNLLTPEAMRATFGKDIVSCEELASEYQSCFGARVSTTAVGKALVKLGLPLQDRRKISLPSGKRVHVQALTNRRHWLEQDNATWVSDYLCIAAPTCVPVT